MELNVVSAEKAREVSLDYQKRNTITLTSEILENINENIKNGNMKFSHQITKSFNQEMMHNLMTELENKGYEVKLICDAISVSWDQKN